MNPLNFDEQVLQSELPVRVELLGRMVRASLAKKLEKIQNIFSFELLSLS